MARLPLDEWTCGQVDKSSTLRQGGERERWREQQTFENKVIKVEQGCGVRREISQLYFGASALLCRLNTSLTDFKILTESWREERGYVSVPIRPAQIAYRMPEIINREQPVKDWGVILETPHSSTQPDSHPSPPPYPSPSCPVPRSS